jgi:hypothetical protein
VIIELSEEYIVQIMSDNESNYKKVCKLVSRKYQIVWQSCLTHTINLIFVTPGFKTKSNAHSMCAHESSLHTYHTKYGYRNTNVTIYIIYY